MKIFPVSPEIPQGPLVLVRAPAKPVEVKQSFEVGDWPVPNAAAQELSGASSNEDTRDSSRPVAAAPNPAGLKEGGWHVFDSSKPCPVIPEGVYSLKYTDGTGSDGWHASPLVSNWEGGATHIAAFRIIKLAPE